MRQKAERLLAAKLAGLAHAEDCVNYGDRIEIRKLWACRTDPESIGLYSAAQVFVVEREVMPKAATVQASKELCYAICSAVADPDTAANGARLLRTFRGHWGVESKSHYRRDVTYGEDRSPVKNHNAARVLAAMKLLAIFLTQIEAHAPKSDRERTLPEFNRACAINGIDRAIDWIKRQYNPLKR